MKIWHAGLLVAGAALAGGLAVRLAEPPENSKPAAIAAAPEPEDPVPAPAVRWKTAPAPPAAEPVASAPPPVYTEPPAPVPAKTKPPLYKKPSPDPVRIAKSAPPPAVAPAVHPTPVPYQEPARHVTLETGLRIAVRLNDNVLAEPVVADGLEVAERGAKVHLRAEDGKLRLMSFQTADGQRIEVSTDPVAAEGDVIRFRLAARITITERRL